MFRAWVGAVPRAVRTARATTQRTQWEDTLRNMFSAQARNFSNKAWKQDQWASRTLQGRSHYGSTRPTFATRRTIIQGQTKRGFRFSPWRRSKGTGEERESLSMGQRFKKLSKEYGKAAVVVYFVLSILDYPFFFLLVRTVGTERVGEFPLPIRWPFLVKASQLTHLNHR